MKDLLKEDSLAVDKVFQYYGQDEVVNGKDIIPSVRMAEATLEDFRRAIVNFSKAFLKTETKEFPEIFEPRAIEVRRQILSEYMLLIGILERFYDLKIIDKGERNRLSSLMKSTFHLLNNYCIEIDNLNRHPSVDTKAKLAKYIESIKESIELVGVIKISETIEDDATKEALVFEINSYSGPIPFDSPAL